MPFNINTTVARQPFLYEPPPVEESTGFGEVVGAAFRRENAVSNAIGLLSRPDFSDDPFFDPFEDLEGTIFEKYPGALVDVNSAEEKAFVEQELLREEEDLRTIEQAGGVGIAASFAAGMIDPLIFVPFGAGVNAARAARTGMSVSSASSNVLRGATMTASAGLFDASATEMILNANQGARTAEESGLNIAAATLLSGIIGGAVSGISHRVFRESVAETEAALGSVAGGSHAAAPPPSVTMDVLNRAAESGSSSNDIKVLQGFGLPAIFGKVRSSPMLEILRFSRSQEARRGVLRMAESPVAVKGFNEDAPSIESVLRITNKLKKDLIHAEKDLYRTFRKRIKNEYPDRRQRKLLSMTRREFSEQAGIAQRADGERAFASLPDEAIELANRHNRVYEDYAQQMIERNMLPEEIAELGPKGAGRYLQRRYDRNKILTDVVREGPDAGKSRFTLRIQSWLMNTMTEGERASAMKLRPDLSPDEASAVAAEHGADSITQHILGLAPGQGIINRLGDSAGNTSPFQGRVLDIPDTSIANWLDNDITYLTERYIDSVAPRIMLRDLDDLYAKQLKGGEPTHTLGNMVQAVRDDYAELQRLAKSDKERIKLKKRLDRDEQIIGAFRDRLLGTFGQNSDFAGLKAGARVVRQLNMTAQLGGVTISSMPDMMMGVMRHGLGRSFRTAISMFDPKTFKFARNEVDLAGAAAEMTLNRRMTELAELGRPGRPGRVEGAIDAVGRPFSLANLLAPWNQFWKSFNGVVTQTRLLEVADSIARGKRLSKADRIDLDQLGISDDMMRRIADQFGATGGGAKRGAIRVARTENWTDDQARLAFRAATGQMVDNTVITPGIGDRPLFMSSEWGKSMFQYKSFALAATTRILTAQAQALRAGDVSRLLGLSMMISMGAVVEHTKNVIAGREVEKDPFEWFMAGLDRSGAIGILGDAAQAAGKVGVGFMDGGPISSRYAARSALSSFGGPSVGFAENVVRMSTSTRQGFTESDVRAGVRMIPYNQLFYWRVLLGALPADIAAEASGAPKTRRRQ